MLETANFSIHLVSSFKQRVKASTLIKRMYATRGYQTESTSVFSGSPNQYTLEARNAQQLLGALTLTIDLGNGLLADQLYRNEIDGFRNEGKNYARYPNLLKSILATFVSTRVHWDLAKSAISAPAHVSMRLQSCLVLTGIIWEIR